jgi:hypothetical protein
MRTLILQAFPALVGMPPPIPPAPPMLVAVAEEEDVVVEAIELIELVGEIDMPDMDISAIEDVM